MAYYAYHCPTHGVFEVRRPMHGFPGESKALQDAALKVQPCPHCKAESPREFTPTAAHFHGNGFHVNDYRGRNAAAG